MLRKMIGIIHLLFIIFLSVNINEKYDLLNVWALSPNIKSYKEYQRINLDSYSDKTILIGTFNPYSKSEDSKKVRDSLCSKIKKCRVSIYF